MLIVISHLTRMSAPRICVAGIEMDTLAHIRPTTPPDDLITRRLLRENRGPFAIGAVVDLGPVSPRPNAPENEDHGFRTVRAKHVEDLSDDRFLSILDAVSCSTLTEGFGPDLQRHNWKYAIDAGCGDRSLAVLRASGRPVLEVDRKFGNLQLKLDTAEGPTYLKVTDVRFYDEDQQTIRAEVVDDVAKRLRRGTTAYLMLGVARAYKASNDDRERHWLQLNGLVLADRAVGDRP